MSEESPPQKQSESMVPYDRFVKVNDDLSNTKLQLEAANKRIAEIEPIAQRAPQLESQLQQVREESEIFRVGLTDPEAITVARALHGALPEADRPPLPAWLASLRDSPANAPRALAPYFAAPPSGAGGSSPASPSQGGAVPPPVPPGAGAASTPAPTTADWAVRLRAAKNTPQWAAEFAAYNASRAPQLGKK